MTLEAASAQLRQQSLPQPEWRTAAKTLLTNPALRGKRVSGLTERRTDLAKLGTAISELWILLLLLLIMLCQDRIEQRILQQGDGGQWIMPAGDSRQLRIRRLCQNRGQVQLLLHELLLQLLLLQLLLLQLLLQVLRNLCAIAWKSRLLPELRNSTA